MKTTDRTQDEKVPLYLDADVQAALSAIASSKNVPLSGLVNDLLRRAIDLIEAVK